METIVQWATILSPIIAVAIALWASKKSAKDTARHIASVEKSTRLQVGSVKELSQIQLETTLMQIDRELSVAQERISQASRRMMEIRQMNPFEIQMKGGLDYQRKCEEEQRQLSGVIEHQQKSVETLKRIKQRLSVISNQL